jgi:hypothetical protein
MKNIELEPCRYCGAPAKIYLCEYRLEETRMVIKCQNCGVELDWTQTYFIKQTNRPMTGQLIEVRAGARNLSAIEVWNGALLKK